MKSLDPHYTAIGIVCAFFVIVLGFSFVQNSHYPVLVIAGEASVGAWMSGVLLVSSAVLSLVIGIQKGWNPWLLFFVFFFLLALDERFMFHEHIKERIVFGMKPVSTAWRWIYELPVLVGALVGTIVALVLWRNLYCRGKILLLCAVIFGSISVAFDLFEGGALIEDGCKLLAELLIALALVGEIAVINEKI